MPQRKTKSIRRSFAPSLTTMDRVHETDEDYFRYSFVAGKMMWVKNVKRIVRKGFDILLSNQGFESREIQLDEYATRVIR